ncbi:MAG: hypothetical protein B6244_08570 [Candidatus Cloacimonetes bacterium 4572_55]|nr:MAG: hypothetical protein B6244_08570 [Candidatus Cloacimonetes bacterium 4572_55]
MVTIKVIYQSSGKPAQSKKVAIGFDSFSRGVAGNEFTDRNGEAHFDAKPGGGKVYVSGSEVYRGRIEGRVVVYI